jgi:hypothetical protein
MSGRVAVFVDESIEDAGRDDLFNLVHDPATLIVAFDRVAGNPGARTAGIDGVTVADVEQHDGVSRFLDDLHARPRSRPARGIRTPALQRRGPGRGRAFDVTCCADPRLTWLTSSRWPARVLRVAVDGPGAAGKSTLAAELARGLVGVRNAVLASVDGFHQSRSVRLQGGRSHPKVVAPR